MITISTEDNGLKSTKRIIVTHTQDNGKRTYIDVWERDKNNNLHFCFRNLWKQPFSDAEYIKELEHQIKELKDAGFKLQEELKATRNNDRQENQNLIYDIIKDNDIKILQKQIETLKQENQNLKRDTRHNTRRAGRKPSKERINAITQVKSLLDKGYSNGDIMELMEISKATFYRYKRECINN